jgi:ribonuclease P/MRP protein subunit POP1
MLIAISYTSGSRILNTHIYKTASYPFHLIAPATIIWKPVTGPPTQGQSTDVEYVAAPVPQQAEAAMSMKKGKRRGRKLKAATKEEGNLRTAWIRFHPAVFNEVFETLKTSISSVLEDIQRKQQFLGSKDKPDEVNVFLSDLRGQVNAFEIMGPRASQILKSVLSPTSGEDREEFKKVNFASNAVTVF